MHSKMDKGTKSSGRIAKIFKNFEKQMGFKNDIKWSSAIAIIMYHLIGVYCTCRFAFPVKWQSVTFAIFMHIVCAIGVTAGAHRLWTHRSYKATTPLKILLLMCFASAGQNSLYEWVRDHRLHHKHSDSAADPHDASRGLFFSHIGWLMMKKNPLVLAKGRQVDMTDIHNDPLLRAFNRNFLVLKLLFCYLLPTAAGVVLWGESWQCAVTWQCFIRFLFGFHSELTVNSFAHLYGYKPYNNKILPVENVFVSFVTLGEGWHNYHHAFPFDYKAGEFDFLNLTTVFIRAWGRIGWAYDLKQATPDMAKSMAKRLGDGSHHHDLIGDENLLL